MDKIVSTLALLLAFFVAGCSSGPKIKLPTENEKFSQIYLDGGTEALYQQKYSEALGSFLEAIKYNPKSAAAWTSMGLAYYGLHENEKAKDAWNKALTVDPKYSEAKTNLAAMLMEENKLAEAEVKFREVLRDLLYTKAYLVHYNLANIYLKEEKPLLAEEHLNLAVKGNRNYCGAWLQLGYLAQKRGDYSVAADKFRGATAGTCYNYPEAHFQLGKSYVRMGDQKSARAKFVELLQNFSQTEWAHMAEKELNMLYSEHK